MEHRVEISDIPKLKENEIYISHVGDGEYNFNVFGSVHKDLNKFIEILRKNATTKEIPLENLFVIKRYDRMVNDLGDYSIYYFGVWRNPDGSEIKHNWEIALITIEQIDPDEFPMG